MKRFVKAAVFSTLSYHCIYIYYVYIYIYIHAYVQTYIHTYIHAYVDTYMHTICIYIYIYIHTRTTYFHWLLSLRLLPISFAFLYNSILFTDLSYYRIIVMFCVPNPCSHCYQHSPSITNTRVFAFNIQNIHSHERQTFSHRFFFFFFFLPEDEISLFSSFSFSSFFFIVPFTILYI